MQNNTTRRELSYSQAIQEALFQAMTKDPNVIVIGEGVPDPKAIFGSTAGLRQQFGSDRVQDMPLSENGLTGVCIGAAIQGIRPVMVHQRIDFALLSLDQIINSAAKWHYMFNGQSTVPLVIRCIIGRGWGQGPQHSQSLQALFAHIPGLHVVMPATPQDAKGLLISAIENNNTVIYLEHRWLHNLKDHVPEEYYATPLNKARILRQGRHLTIAAISYMVMEATRAADVLRPHGIEVEVIDMRSVRPLDTETVVESVKKTGHLVILDTAFKTCGVSAEIYSQVCELAWNSLKKPPIRVASPDHYVPTSHFQADHYYPEADAVVHAVLKCLDQQGNTQLTDLANSLTRKLPRDVPYTEFKGPF